MFRVGKNFTHHLIPTLLLWAETPSTRPQQPGVAQSPVQTCLEHFQGWVVHSFSGQSIPVPHIFTVKILLLISNLTLPSEFKISVPYPVSTGLGKITLHLSYKPRFIYQGPQ